MENTKKINFIFKILILLFGVITILTGHFFYSNVTAVIANPPGTVYISFRFGILFIPTNFFGENYTYTYDTSLYVVFAILFVIGFLLNFGYIYKEGSKSFRRYLNVLSVLILGIGLIGIVITPNFTVIKEIPPTSITSFSYDRGLLSGFQSAIILMVFILIEFIVLEKTSVGRKKDTGKKIAEPEPAKPAKIFCSSCGSEIVDASGGFCSKCGAPIK